MWVLGSQLTLHCSCVVETTGAATCQQPVEKGATVTKAS